VEKTRSHIFVGMGIQMLMGNQVSFIVKVHLLWL